MAALHARQVRWQRGALRALRRCLTGLALSGQQLGELCFECGEVGVNSFVEQYLLLGVELLP
jgi:hypothetical protein